MTDPTLESIEAALAAATPAGKGWDEWPHDHIEDGCKCGSCRFVTVWRTRNYIDCEEVPVRPGETKRCDGIGYSWEDAHLIANAPAWLAYLVQRVKTAEAERDEMVAGFEASEHRASGVEEMFHEWRERALAAEAALSAGDER